MKEHLLPHITNATNSQKQNTINPNFSKRITALRFILACLVVLIHAKVNEYVTPEGTFYFKEIAPNYVKAIIDALSNIIGGIAVPTFFIISGYLFFAKPKSISDTLQSKFKSIVLPYILWTVLVIIFYFVAQYFNYTKSFFSKIILREWTWNDFLSAFWKSRYRDGDNPFIFQFWYLRDLIIMMIISPLIKLLGAKVPFAYFSGVTILFMSTIIGIVPNYLNLVSALFYFSLGLFAVNHIEAVMDFVDSIRLKEFLFSFIIMLTATVYARLVDLPGNNFMYHLSIWFTILLAIKVAGIILMNGRLFLILEYLSGFSFWIYALHEPLVLTSLKKLTVRIMPMEGWFFVVQFFVDSIVCIFVLLISGIVIKKIMPKVFALFTGGRIK